MKTQEETLTDRHAKQLLVWLFVLLYIAVWLRTAWVCDDAFITMRTVDNFHHGLGLRWNPSERVQSYSHPLWMFCLAAMYGLVRNAYIALLLPSFLFSIGTVLIVAFRISRTPTAAILALTALSLSKAFVDYSSSGLENPLTHLLLALFWYVYLQFPSNKRCMVLLCLITSFAMLCRMDAILFLAPALGIRLLQSRSWRTLGASFVGGAPILLWAIFSLIYYGFLFPNTYYAKLGTAIPTGGLILQGVCYWLHAVDYDVLTLIVILLALIFVFVSRSRSGAIIASGIVLYSIYGIMIGGDFMAGRFFSAALLCAVIIIAGMPMRIHEGIWLLLLGALIVISFLAPAPLLLSGSDYHLQADKANIAAISKNGIADERAFYYARTGLLRFYRNEPWPYVSSKYLNLTPDSNGIVIHGSVGILGFYGARQQYHVLDFHALTDPLLARLPVRDRWRIGHFARRIPEGYAATLGSGENKIAHPGLASYYDVLSLITQGPLLSKKRLLTIVRMNLGCYDHLLADYSATMPPYDPTRDRRQGPEPQTGKEQFIQEKPFTTKESPPIIFEDFESGNYNNWRIEGACFGSAPARGTLPNQRQVLGFKGKYLVNTYWQGDSSVGRAESTPFVIERRYISFLIGGGNHTGKTCINLKIHDRIIKTAAGRNSETLREHKWDVEEYIGAEAVIEIVDSHKGRWGHILIDHIVFSDQ